MPAMKILCLSSIFFGLCLLRTGRGLEDDDSSLDDIMEQLESVEEEMSGGCRSQQMFEHSYPNAMSQAGEMHFLLNNTQNQDLADFAHLCVKKCCDSTALCDYVWIYQMKCISIKCKDPESCKPKENLGLNSTMIKILKGLPSPTPSDAPRVTSSVAQQQTPSVVPHATSAVMSHTTSSVSPSALPSPSPKTTTLPVTENIDKDPVKLTVTTDKDSYKIQLPVNRQKVFGNVHPMHGLDLTWHWQVVSGPNTGTVEGSTEPTFVMKGLTEGVYHVKVTVSVTGSHRGDYLPGESHFDVTVLPALRKNKPPHIVFGTQPNVTLRIPDTTYVLSASGTTDDDEENPVHYKWELMSKPVGAPSIEPSTQERLQLKDLKEGNYVIRLTVTDSDGVSSSESAYITVEPEKDDPPTADTGGSVHKIRLPLDHITIRANKSQDDHGIKEYKWEQIDTSDKDKLININGVHTPFLMLSGLQKGSYQFRLTVTDTKGQTDSTMVSVVVDSESFKPPVAKADPSLTVHFPQHSVVLNGSASTDDYEIISYSWTLLSGPDDVKIDHADEQIATATNLHIKGTSPTVYLFQLNVTNYRHLSSQFISNVTVYKDNTIPPSASAGPDVVVHLPQHVVVLNGSGSYDDFGIVEYKWNRSDDSPAAGIVEEGSEKTAILKLSNVVSGVYTFTLCVTNEQGTSNCDSTVLTVLPEKNNLSIIQLVLDKEVTDLKSSELENLMTGVELELAIQRLDHVDLTVIDVYKLESDMVVEFTVTKKVTKDPINGSEILDKMESFIGGGEIRGITIKKLDTKVCQNPCSGHGTCNQRTKTCQCDIFWMENFVKSHYGTRRSNCEWSVLYFVLIILGIVLIIFLIFWIACCCHIRRRRMKRRKRIKYALLQNQNDGQEGDMKLTHRLKRRQKGGVPVSDSESEDDVLFDKKSNSSETPPPGYNNLGNGKFSTKASSLIKGLIPH